MVTLASPAGLHRAFTSAWQTWNFIYVCNKTLNLNIYNPAYNGRVFEAVLNNQPGENIKWFIDYINPFDLFPKVSYDQIDKTNFLLTEEKSEKHGIYKQYKQLRQYIHFPVDNMKDDPQKFIDFLKDKISSRTVAQLLIEASNWNRLIEEAYAVAEKLEHRNDLLMMQANMNYEAYRKLKKSPEQKDALIALSCSKWAQLSSVKGMPETELAELTGRLYNTPGLFKSHLNPTQCKLKALHFAYQGKLAGDESAATFLEFRLNNGGDLQKMPAEYFKAVKNLAVKLLVETVRNKAVDPLIDLLHQQYSTPNAILDMLEVSSIKKTLLKTFPWLYAELKGICEEVHIPKNKHFRR